jgi:hypothetical protein
MTTAVSCEHFDMKRASQYLSKAPLLHVKLMTNAHAHRGEDVLSLELLSRIEYRRTLLVFAAASWAGRMRKVMLVDLCRE